MIGEKPESRGRVPARMAKLETVAMTRLKDLDEGGKPFIVSLQIGRQLVRMGPSLWRRRASRKCRGVPNLVSSSCSPGCFSTLALSRWMLGARSGKVDIGFRPIARPLSIRIAI